MADCSTAAMSVPAGLSGPRPSGGDGAPPVRITDLSIRYRRRRGDATFLALDGINLTVRPGELVSLIGPSGCGKSSLLGAVAGLVPYQGAIEVFGQPVTGPGVERGLVLQSASLLPWRTVYRNISFGLELQGFPKAKVKAATEAALELVGLTASRDNYPKELSGGMQQRVNFARAFASDPPILLMDEPFAALDARTREHLQLELLSIWDRTHWDTGHTPKSALFVTHQIDEAVLLSDRVVLLSSGPRAQIVDIVDVNLGRPRDNAVRTDERFLEAVRDIRRRFDDAEREHYVR